MVKLGGFLGLAMASLMLPALAAAPTGNEQAKPPAASQADDPATRSAIQKVITQQLEALARDDGKTAESFASSAVQGKFPEPDKFLAMVKKGYGALLKPRSTKFGKSAVSPHGALQEMTLVAADGTLWTALYSLEPADGSWRITGCSLQKVDGQDI